MPKEIVWTPYISGITKFFKHLKGKKGLFLQGPQGIIFEDDAPDKKFNLFNGDCNFLITINDYNKIATVLGVEAIFPVTPYKVRIGIAKMFDEKQVLEKINEKIDPFKGIHLKIINEYVQAAKNKYEDFIVYEDFNSMINIGKSSEYNSIDGFLISSGQIPKNGV